MPPDAFVFLNNALEQAEADPGHTLLVNAPFMRGMTSERWRMKPDNFEFSLFDGCPGHT